MLWPMELMAADLGFAPLDYAWALRLAGWAAIALEVLLLLVRIWSNRSGGSAALLTVGCLAGPVTAPAAALWSVVGMGSGDSAGPWRAARLFARAAVLELMLLIALLGLPPGWPNAAVVNLALLAGLWAIRSYRRTTTPVNRRIKAALLAMRIAAIVLLACWAARPRLEYYHDRQIRQTVLVGIDVSGSMGRRDMPPSYRMSQIPEQADLAARIDSVSQALSDTAELWSQLAEQADVQIFTFGRSASAAAPMLGQSGRQIVSGLAARVDGTALSEATLAAAAQQQEMGRKLACVVLITDGNDNASRLADPQRLAEQMRLRSVPLYTVAAGWNEVTASTKSLQIEQLEAAEVVDAFSRLPISAQMRALGLAGREVEVSCRFGPEVIETRRIAIEQDDASLDLQFVHVPLQVGYHRLQVEAKLLGPEPKNYEPAQHPSRLVQVVDREIRLLYLEGRIVYESKYIAQAIASGRRFSLDRRVLSGGSFARGPGALSEDIDDWLGYHAIVLGSIQPDRFSQKQLEILRTLVDEKGKGLAMIGGPESFGAGGWGRSPLAEVLPLDWDNSSGQIDQPVQVEPTPAGRDSGLMQIGQGNDVQAAWARLGPLPGANRIAARPGGRVLAVDQASRPMIIAGQYGAGRTVAIAFDETWRWVLTPEDTQALQKRFWRQVALFLANPKGNVWITTDQPSYDLSVLQTTTRSQTITAGVEDAAGRPVSDPQGLEVTLSDPKGNARKLDLVRERDVLTGQLPSIQSAGTYRLAIRAVVAGQQLVAEHQFEVLRRDLEGREVLADYELLETLAARTRGRFVPLRDLPSQLEALQVESTPQIQRVFEPVDLWRQWAWPVVAVVMALLCGEWVLRRKRGLI
ncbi:MAG: glutamine amidotransferase [Phycisphaerae bacterium]